MGQNTHRPCGQPRGELITPMTFTPEMLRTFFKRRLGPNLSFIWGDKALRISELRGIQLSSCSLQNSNFNLLRLAGSVAPTSITREASSDRSEASMGDSNGAPNFRPAPPRNLVAHSKQKVLSSPKLVACQLPRKCRGCCFREGLCYHNSPLENFHETRSPLRELCSCGCRHQSSCHGIPHHSLA